MTKTLVTGHEEEMEYLNAENITVSDMCRAVRTQADETLSQNDAFAAVFGEKTPEDFADYLEKLASLATAFAAKIRSGNYAK